MQNTPTLTTKERLLVYKTAAQQYTKVYQNFKHASIYFHIQETCTNLSIKETITPLIYYVNRKVHNRTEIAYQFYYDIYNHEQLKIILPEAYYIIKADPHKNIQQILRKIYKETKRTNDKLSILNK